MKNRIVFCICLLVVVWFWVGCTNEEVEESQAMGKKAWTFMLYDDADFRNAFDPWADFISRMVATEHIHVLVLRDRTNPEYGIHAVHEDGSTEMVETMDSLNMGDPASIGRLLNFARARYPSERTIIAFYDHGAGFLGACTDLSHNDWLTMPEIRQGLEEGGGVDVVLFSAPCLMGAIESMVELRHQTGLYIGSENLSGYCFWRHTMADIRETLTAEPHISTMDLGRRIIEQIKYHLPEVDARYPDSSKTVTMSAVRTDRLGDLVSLFDEITVFYSERPDQFKRFMDSHLSHIQTYAGFNMDLHSLATHLAGYEDDPAMTAKLVELQSRIDQAVIAEIHGEDVPGSGGIAIHFPKPGEIAFHPDDYSIVAFAAATRWDEILQSYCQTAAGCSPSLQELADKLREIARSQAQTVPRR